MNILVVGNICSGKSTLARRLAQEYGLRHVELDAIYWLPEWRGESMENFSKRVQEDTEDGGWVVDGNYSLLRPIFWDRVDLLVLFDLPLYLTLFRLFKRSVHQVVSRERLWGGNRESFARIISFKSPFLWAIKTDRRRRHEFPELARRAKQDQKAVVVVDKTKDFQMVIREISQALGQSGHSNQED